MRDLREGLTTLERWARVDATDPLPSIDDTARQIGISPPRAAPGDTFAEDTDLPMYWPAVRAWWEPSARRVPFTPMAPQPQPPGERTASEPASREYSLTTGPVAPARPGGLDGSTSGGEGDTGRTGVARLLPDGVELPSHTGY